MLHMSGVGSGTGHVTLMLSQPADASDQPYTKVGTIVPDGSVANQWDFSTAQHLKSKNQEIVCAQNWHLRAGNPVAGRTATAGWVEFTDNGYQNGFSDGPGPPGDFVPQYRFSPVGRAITWRGVASY